MTWLLLCFHSLEPVAALAEVNETQYRQAVQTRMDEVVRAGVFEFFSRANLAVPLVEQVVATPQFAAGEDQSLRISELNLRVELITDHPADVIRQLRQYLGQTLNREGFALDPDPATYDTVLVPALALTLNIKEPASHGLRADLTSRWQEILIFTMITIAFLSVLAFGAFLLYLPFSRRRRLVFVPEVEAARAAKSHTPEVGLPVLPSNTVDNAVQVPPLDKMLAREKEKQNFPVWIDKDGARVADLEGIRKSFEALPFDEAIEMLSCLDEADRNIILSKLNLNPSVRERVRKELSTRAPVLST